MCPASPRTDPVLISACLLGLCCRYDGSSCTRDLLVEFAGRCAVVPVCPEQLGGLPTPRPAAWIEAGAGEEVLAGKERVIDEQGEDRSEAFCHGAAESLALARLFACRTAILKERSPSCGVRQISRDGNAVEGRGVTAALLAGEGIELLGDEDPRLAEILVELYEADV